MFGDSTRRGSGYKLRRMRSAGSNTNKKNRIDFSPTRKARGEGAKVLVRPHQAESTKGKNVIIGTEKLEAPRAISTQPMQKASRLGGQDKGKVEGSARAGLSGGKHRTVRCTSPDCPVPDTGLSREETPRLRVK
ncbi:hypothetical protein U9M48_004595 [Paspalum notatum var. saurae]|uniref:Uncharacterized protein n=1 Tax=Paspalum notatum var. saurae TaxID=547442 RepID=A0AAQ3PNA8_PASNO